MNCSVTGKLILLLPIVSGTSKSGNQYKNRAFVVEEEGQYAKKVCLTIFGDKVDTTELRVGAEYKIDFNVESKEYNGKWYSENGAYKIECLKPAPAQQQSQNPDLNW
jgi:hypothetical protein